MKTLHHWPRHWPCSLLTCWFPNFLLAQWCKYSINSWIVLILLSGSWLLFCYFSAILSTRSVGHNNTLPLPLPFRPDQRESLFVCTAHCNCTLDTKHKTLYTNHCMLHTAHSSLNTEYFALHTMYYTQHITHYTLFSVNCASMSNAHRVDIAQMKSLSTTLSVGPEVE